MSRFAKFTIAISVLSTAYCAAAALLGASLPVIVVGFVAIMSAQILGCIEGQGDRK